MNFKELLSCGNSECCIYDMSETRQVAVGDFLLIKGTKYPKVANALVHKSPAMAKGPLGNVINRLVLKVDVHELRDQRTPSKVARATKV